VHVVRCRCSLGVYARARARARAFIERLLAHTHAARREIRVIHEEKEIMPMRRDCDAAAFHCSRDIFPPPPTHTNRRRCLPFLASSSRYKIICHLEITAIDAPRGMDNRTARIKIAG